MHKEIEELSRQYQESVHVSYEIKCFLFYRPHMHEDLIQSVSSCDCSEVLNDITIHGAIQIISKKI